MMVALVFGTGTFRVDIHCPLSIQEDTFAAAVVDLAEHLLRLLRLLLLRTEHCTAPTERH